MKTTKTELKLVPHDTENFYRYTDHEMDAAATVETLGEQIFTDTEGKVKVPTPEEIESATRTILDSEEATPILEDFGKGFLGYHDTVGDNYIVTHVKMLPTPSGKPDGFYNVVHTHDDEVFSIPADEQRWHMELPILCTLYDGTAVYKDYQGIICRSEIETD